MSGVLRLGLIGFGAIGQAVAAALAAEESRRVALAAVLVRRARSAVPGLALTDDPERFFARRFDAVLETAGHQAVRDHGERVLADAADLLVTSVGALADDALRTRLLAAAEKAGRRLILPSAGIGALDILSAAAVGGLDHVAITVRKDPQSWKGTPAEAAHDLDRLAEAVTLYDGPVREGARRYPQNVNIAAAVALAGVGLDRTRLVVIADPAITTHVVEVEAEGAFGRFHFVEDVIPTAENRKTGKLVGMAVVKTVRQLAASLVVGA
jgi:aspartate dehydrogenase